MEDLRSEPPHVSPRQDEIQGRPHGGSSVAPVTPEIAPLGYNFEYHIKDEDPMDTIQRLQKENRALREAQLEDIKEAEESTQLITALQQRLQAERTHQVHHPRPSVGGSIFAKDTMHD